MSEQPINSSAPETTRWPRFSEVWERDARWIMGPGLLSDVIHFLKGKALVAVQDADDPTSVVVTIPLPTVLDEISGKRVDVLFAVPEELRGIFLAKCEAVLDGYRAEVNNVLDPLCNARATPALFRQLNAALSRIADNERAREALPPRTGPWPQVLWWSVANAFGFDWYDLPEPAGMAT